MADIRPNAQPWPSTPQTPEPREKGESLKIIFGAVCAVVVIALMSSVSSGGDAAGTGDKAAPKSPTATAEAAEEAKGKPAEAKGRPAEPKDKPAGEAEPPPGARSQSDQFKAYVGKHGTPTEKAAVRHVTKVQGAEKQNDILDAAEVYTDCKGGTTGSHACDGKLIASAFADWKDSADGLVTVYDANGELLSNGNF